MLLRIGAMKFEGGKAATAGTALSDCFFFSVYYKLGIPSLQILTTH